MKNNEGQICRKCGGIIRETSYSEAYENTMNLEIFLCGIGTVVFMIVCGFVFIQPA